MSELISIGGVFGVLILMAAGWHGVLYLILVGLRRLGIDLSHKE